MKVFDTYKQLSASFAGFRLSADQDRSDRGGAGDRGRDRGVAVERFIIGRGSGRAGRLEGADGLHRIFSQRV